MVHASAGLGRTLYPPLQPAEIPCSAGEKSTSTQSSARCNPSKRRRFYHCAPRQWAETAQPRIDFISTRKNSSWEKNVPGKCIPGIEKKSVRQTGREETRREESGREESGREESRREESGREERFLTTKGTKRREKSSCFLVFFVVKKTYWIFFVKSS